MKSISAKLTLLQLTCASLVVMLVYSLMDMQLTRRMTEDFNAHGSFVAGSLAKSAEPALIHHDLVSVQSALDETSRAPGVVWAFVTGPDRRILADTFVPAFPEALLARITELKSGEVFLLSQDAAPVVVYCKPVLTGIVGQVYVGFSRESLLASIHSMELTILLSIAGVMLFVTLLFAVETRRIIAPVNALTSAAAELGGPGGTAFQTLPVMAEDEIGVLTRTFNAMAVEIREHAAALEARVRERTADLTRANQDLATEVAERKHMAEALAESSDMIRLLLDSTPEAIYGVDLESRCTFCNPAFLRILGYDQPGDLLGRRLHELIHHSRPDGSPYPFTECRILREGGQNSEVHIDDEIFWRRDGTPIPVECWSRPIFRGEQVIGSVVTFVDVTERKRAEIELRNAKEATEAANRSKSTFLATMSHEIRTPMNGILGMTELVLGTTLSEEQRENLGLVKLSAESLLAIVNDVLDFSKIEAGRLEIEQIPFSLRESIGETMRGLSFRAGQKGLELICDVDPELPETVLGDPGRIRQVLINLVGNAIKFTARGEILVTVKAESNDDRHVLLWVSVKDTGIGIPRESQAKIFEAFSQADGSMTRKYGGTGLGLTICVRLVAAMGGRIWLESEPGRGSTFQFTVPLGVQAAPVVPAPALAPVELRGLSVLVVDDNRTNRRVLCGMLGRWGMEITAVESGRGALAALERAAAASRGFALILLDGQMPEMDGFMLAQAIKQRPQISSATVMMITSAGRIGDAARCRQVGISAYLLKPVRQAELLGAIRHALRPPSAGPQEALITRHSVREAMRHARILLAEDNAVNQKLATRLLEKRGCTVTVAENGRAALAALESSEFDLILMDVQMPEMDGFQATQAIREKENLTRQHIPIVAMTAHAMKGDEERCLAAGMDAYVSKPIRAAEFYATVEAWLAKATGTVEPVSTGPDS